MFIPTDYNAGLQPGGMGLDWGEAERWVVICIVTNLGFGKGSVKFLLFL
jgi:hypothetical protein